MAIRNFLAWTCLLGSLSWACDLEVASGQEPTRVTDGIQVLYDFRGDGPFIKDIAGVGKPLDLRIEDSKAVHRGSDAMEVHSRATIRSEQPATKVIDAVKRSGELTIEAWVRPAKTNQAGPARIVTLSSDTSQRNFTLGQENATFDVRLRTNATDSNGLPSLATPGNRVKAALAHVVYTRNRAGQAKIYLNGQPVASRNVKGSFANWDGNFKLSLANEVKGDRVWLGTFHLVAIYSRSLSPGDVKRNFVAGHDIRPVRQPSEPKTTNEGQGSRVAAGLQVLYDFRESEGNEVKDRSGVGKPIDLRIENVKQVRRAGGVLHVTGNTVIRSLQPAKRLVDAVGRSNSLTVEAWIRPTGLNQKGPARIVTLSKDANERNFTLGQDSDRLEIRLRTTDTSSNGIPAINSAAKSLREKLTHIVYTRDARGVARIYLDGRQKEQKQVAGAIRNWNDSFRLALANELSGDRPWRGEMHLVAIYSRDLSPAEVAQNHRAGPNGRAGDVLVTKSDDSHSRRFETEIAPLLSRHCLECHDSASRQGGLDLSRKAAAFAGGESGKVDRPGKVIRESGLGIGPRRRDAARPSALVQ